MTTLKNIDLTCPNCENQFTSAMIEDADLSGRRRTDFQVESFGVPPLPFGVHLCERCGFAGPKEWFEGETSISQDVRRHVWDELTPRVSSAGLTASEKYEFAAKVAVWDGATARDIAELWLRAAWCCVDENDIEAERYYRRFAARGFEECLSAYDLVPRKERAVITYLVAELWRRIGDATRASYWFDRVPGEIINRHEQAWITRWAIQQQDQPREWFI